jgi:hypothetical protein
MGLRSDRSADLKSLRWYSTERLAGVGYMRIVHRVTHKVRIFAFAPEMEELVRRGPDWRAVGSREATHTRNSSYRPTSKILCRTLASVTRATAELPSFHGVSRTRSAARSYERGQRRKCSPVVALPTLVTNRQSMAIINALNGRPIAMRSTRLLWKEPGGYKVQSGLDRKALALRKNVAAIGFRAARTRVELATCGF